MQNRQKPVEQLDRIPQSDIVLEVDMPIIPSPVLENDHPYFPFIPLVLDPHSECIVHFELLTPHSSASEMYGRCGHILAEALLKANVKPRTIQIKLPRLLEVFDSVFEHVDIHVEFKSSLPEVKKAFMSLLDHFSRGHA